MIFHSIRWRVQTWHGLILVTVLTGFGLTAYHVARENQLRRIDQDLEQRLGEASHPRPPRRPPPDQLPRDLPPHGQPPPDDHFEKRPGYRGDIAFFQEQILQSLRQAAAATAGETNSFYYVMWQTNGALMYRSSGAPDIIPLPVRVGAAWSDPLVKDRSPGEPPQFRPGPPIFAPARMRGQWREVYRYMPLGDCVLVGRSIAPELAGMRRLAVWLMAAGTGVLVLGLAGGWWLAARAIRPIEDISATAAKIAAGDLSQRISVADADNELGRLAGVLNSTFARLEAAFANQARFTSDASHELRTPVSVILTQTQTALMRERPAAEYRETLEACQRAAQRMRQLTQSLLELARLDAGQEPMKRELFDLSRVVRECVEMVRPLAAERRVEIYHDVPVLPCLGDAERISQVVTNLLANAIHFNREGGDVRISALEANGSALLMVTDTGEGIPAEDLPHIFERFYRVDKSRSRTHGRTGLGLAICKAIVDTHGGAIEVVSQPGKGSTFTVRLPRS